MNGHHLVLKENLTPLDRAIPRLSDFAWQLKSERATKWRLFRSHPSIRTDNKWLNNLLHMYLFQAAMILVKATALGRVQRDVLNVPAVTLRTRKKDVKVCLSQEVLRLLKWGALCYLECDWYISPRFYLLQKCLKHSYLSTLLREQRKF